MKFLFITNSPFKQSVAEQAADFWRSLLQREFGIDSEFIYRTADFPEIYEQVHPKYKGLSWKLYDTFRDEMEDCHISFLFHAPDPKVEGIANFTYGDNNGTMTWLDDFIKIQISWDERWALAQLLGIVEHEGIHGLHGVLRLQGIFTKDTMDDGTQGEFESVSRARVRENIERIKTYKDVLMRPMKVTLYKSLLKQMIVLLEKAVKIMTLKPTLRQLAEAMGAWETKINGMEFHPNSLGMRNNNPTNLRFSPFAKSYYENENGRYAVFESFEKGEEAAVWDLKAKQAGRSSWATRETTLYELIKRWSGDENAEAYISFVCKRISINPWIQLKDFA